MTHAVLHVLLLALLEDDLRSVRAFLRRHLNTARRTLDVGCGPGLFADLFASGDYVGVDPRRRFVDHARRYRPGIFLAEDPAHVDLPAGRFDQAFGFDLLGPLGDNAARAALVELRRLVVPGGRLVMIERARSAHRLERLCRDVGRIESQEPLRSGLRSRVAAVAALAEP